MRNTEHDVLIRPEITTGEGIVDAVIRGIEEAFEITDTKNSDRLVLIFTNLDLIKDEHNLVRQAFSIFDKTYETKMIDKLISTRKCVFEKFYIELKPFGDIKDSYFDNTPTTVLLVYASDKNLVDLRENMEHAIQTTLVGVYQS
jgi:hypothetical protein